MYISTLIFVFQTCIQFYFLSLSNRNFSFDDLLVRKVVGGTAVHFVIIVVIIFITYVITNPSDSSLSNI